MLANFNEVVITRTLTVMVLKHLSETFKKDQRLICPTTIDVGSSDLAIHVAPANGPDGLPPAYRVIVDVSKYNMDSFELQMSVTNPGFGDEPYIRLLRDMDSTQFITCMQAYHQEHGKWFGDLELMWDGGQWVQQLGEGIPPELFIDTNHAPQAFKPYLVTKQARERFLQFAMKVTSDHLSSWVEEAIRCAHRGEDATILDFEVTEGEFIYMCVYLDEDTPHLLIRRNDLPEQCILLSNCPSQRTKMMRILEEMIAPRGEDELETAEHMLTLSEIYRHTKFDGGEFFKANLNNISVECSSTVFPMSKHLVYKFELPKNRRVADACGERHIPINFTGQWR